MTAIEDPLRGRIAYDGARTPLKAALFLLVCLAWLLPGLVGHDPWKSDEAALFGVVNEILQSGDWVLFRIAGEPYFDKAPLFIWVAALFAKLFGGVLPLHDAARLSAGFFMAGTLTFLSLASRELMGARAVRLGVLLFIGCLGLLIRAHEMMTDLAGLTGVAMGLYGLALAHRRPKTGGFMTGLGIGVAFLGNGFLPAGLLVGLIALLPATSAFWRTRQYALTVAIAVVTAAPLTAIWPMLLAGASPSHLQIWLDNAAASRWSEPFAHDNGMEMLYFTRILPWYAWPAWPLAAWALWRSRRTLFDRRELMLPLTAFIAFFLVTSVFGDARDASGFALLLPLAILGAAELDSVPRGAASALDWFGMMTFLSLGAILWVAWTAAMTGSPQFAAAAIAKELPEYKYKFSFIAFSLASLLTLIWVVVVARSLRSPRRALVNWSAGITMVWMLMMTIGLPLVEQARSYRGVSARIVDQLPKQFTCIARQNLGDAQRALLDYFAGLRTIRVEFPASSHCGALLVQAAPLKIPTVGPEWSEVWRGSRPGDRNELFILYWRVAESQNRGQTPISRNANSSRDRPRA
jgi:4-amino-4-deoxy-L-arabinose transferase-like glycosyltransferase